MGVGGCPWRVPSVRRASRGILVGPVKNDRNFSGGYACGAAAQSPHRGTPGQKTSPPARSLSNPRRCCVQSCPIRCRGQSQQAISDLAYLLRPQVRGQSVPIRHHTPVNRWGLGGIAVQVLSAYDLHMLLLSVHPCPLLSFVNRPCQPARPCAYDERVNHRQPDDRFRLAQHPDLR